MRRNVYERVLGQLLAAAGLSLSLGASGCGETEPVFEQPSPQECMSMPQDGTNYYCDMTVDEGEQWGRVCVAAGPDGECSTCDDEDLRMEAEDQVGGYCGFTNFHRVACGPVEQNAMCCYDVVYGYDANDPCFNETTAGRPFLVEGRARLAVLSELSDAGAWAMAMEVELSELSSAQRVVLAEEWTRDGLDEHASIPAFARHVMELMALGAPPALVGEAALAMQDEIEHARLCFGLASAYAGRPVGPGEMAMEGAIPGEVDEVEVVRGLIREGCIGETLAAIVAGRARDAAREPVVAAVLDTIADDESRHAALAWKTLRWLLDRAAARGDRRLAAVARITFAHALRAAKGGGILETSALRGHGRLSSGERAAVIAKAVDRVLAPTAAALFRETGAARLASAVLDPRQVEHAGLDRGGVPVQLV